MATISSWPPYPPEFEELDYALRSNGWLVEYQNKVDARFFAVEYLGELIAFTILSKTGETEAEFRIALRADRIGQGFGRAITNMTLAKGFTAIGLTRIHLIVRKNNHRAISLYKSFGFTVRGECFKSVNGKQVHFQVMELLKESYPQKGGSMNRALLAIDVQNEYFFGKLPVSYPPNSLDNILMVMKAAAANQISVAVIQHAAKVETSPVFKKGSLEWKLHPDVEKQHRDVLIEKNWPDSFTETKLEEWLKSKNIDTITVCGYMTQMCCDTTARRAFHLGYAVEFLSDATGTLSFQNEAGSVTDEELHRAILVTQSRFSKVMKSDDWVSSIQIKS